VLDCPRTTCLVFSMYFVGVLLMPLLLIVSFFVLCLFPALSDIYVHV